MAIAGIDISPGFIFDLESRMRIITENEYARLAAAKDWTKFVKIMPSGNKQEIVHWLISTANIYDMGTSHGKQVFEDSITTYTTYVPNDHRSGLKINRQELADLDGNGVLVATSWAEQIAAQMAYYPQKLFTDALKNANLVTYDGLSMFNAAHPTTGITGDLSQGTFSNILATLPIDDSVSVDVALSNLSKAQAQIAGLKMPNGTTPRMLKATTLIVPPRLAQRAAQLTNAKFVAQAAAGGAGSADVEALIGSLGIGSFVVFPELAAAFGGSDTVYYLACEDIAGATQLGAYVLVERDPFVVTYYTGEGGGTGVDAVLDRGDELEWHLKGRMVVGAGHPYLIFKSA